MKKFKLVTVAAAAALVTTACGTDGDAPEETEGAENGEAVEESEEDESDEDDEAADEEEIVIGASSTPHAEILEYAEEALEEEGISLEIETFNDYVLPNEALDSGELDANYFQHVPYFESQIEDHGYDFDHVGGIHIEPIAVYSQDYDSLDELPEGAEILMSDSVADHGRVLSMLEDEGLIELEDGAGIDATTDDIVENERDLEFRADVEAGLLPQAYRSNEAEAVLINSNYAIDHDLNPAEDGIAMESADLDNPYANIIAVQSEDAEDEKYHTLVEVLRSEDVQEFILDEFDEAVVPVGEDQ
ncbi:D-methionine transport system substrate-binding protein [Salsuginibacillus halophilus]|uniref:Lipoprotein n=1 Tax=Salsuginibacillus halophilus TaxID=517424 RepID=A0A2P8HDX7_9BACI|nr:MetQ/NlpA family ABC transporter substrate-binding protein [Salsuginibacillus halophilus]PSL44427.1 D-methionine transport system substrate-binding protein [Salsuginibacillus halophilus]